MDRKGRNKQCVCSFYVHICVLLRYMCTCSVLIHVCVLFIGIHVFCLHTNMCSVACVLLMFAPHWGDADAEIKVPSGENTEDKRSPFKAWSRSVYSHTCYAYCQGFLPCLFLPFRSIHLHFSKTSRDISCVGCG